MEGVGEETSPIQEVLTSPTKGRRIFYVFLHHFWLHFDTLFASICMLPRTLFLTFSFLFRKGFPLGSLSPFWLFFGRLSAPIWLSFGVPLLDTFGFRCLLFVTFVLKFSLFPRFPSSSAYVPNIYLMRGKPRSRHRFESRILVAYGGNRYENFKSYPMSYVPGP